MTYNVQRANFGAPNPESRKPMIVEIVRFRGRRHRRPARTRVDPPSRCRGRTAGPLRLLRWTEREECRADPAEEERPDRRWRRYGHPRHRVGRFVRCHLPRRTKPPWGRLRVVQYPLVLQQPSLACHPARRHAGTQVSRSPSDRQVSRSPGDRDGGSQLEARQRHDELPSRAGGAGDVPVAVEI